MRLEYQILTAVALDLALGDPRWLPHPVRGIGWLALRLESLARRALEKKGTGTSPDAQSVEGHQSVFQKAMQAGLEFRLQPAKAGTPARFAGVVATMGVYVVAGTAAWGIIALAGLVHPWAADVASIVILYSTIAARDLARHSMAVLRPLVEGDLVEARRRVGAIVGRDTDRLDESGVIRAAVESVAESTVDGVTAPLFFAAVAGPVGAMVYRAVNTLDSMFGHQDDRYREFGWAAARIDDAANYLPARLTAPLVCLGAFLLRLRPASALRILVRDGRLHASPNAGLSEAAVAGALGVQLGGVNYYDGEPLARPTIGDPIVPLAVRHIRLANALMLVTTGLFLAVSLALRAGALHLWQAWRVVP